MLYLYQFVKNLPNSPSDISQTMSIWLIFDQFTCSSAVTTKINQVQTISKSSSFPVHHSIHANMIRICLIFHEIYCMHALFGSTGGQYYYLEYQCLSFEVSTTTQNTSTCKKRSALLPRIPGPVNRGQYYYPEYQIL